MSFFDKDGNSRHDRNIFLLISADPGAVICAGICFRRGERFRRKWSEL